MNTVIGQWRTHASRLLMRHLNCRFNKFSYLSFYFNAIVGDASSHQCLPVPHPARYRPALRRGIFLYGGPQAARAEPTKNCTLMFAPHGHMLLSSVGTSMRPLALGGTSRKWNWRDFIQKTSPPVTKLNFPFRVCSLRVLPPSPPSLQR